MSGSNRKLASLVGLAIAAVSAGCNPNPPKMDPARPLAYIEARRAFGKALAEEMSNTTSLYELVPIVGPVYPPGWVVDANNPADPIDSEACLVADAKLPEVKWAGVGFEDKLRKDIDLSAALPGTIQRYVSEIVDVSAGFKNNKNVLYSWTNPIQRLPTQKDFLEAITSDTCQKAVDNRDVLFIRGIVTLEEAFEQGASLGANAQVKFFKEDAVKLLYNNEGSFKLTDAGPVPYYHIVARLPAGTSLRGGQGTEEQLLAAPTPEQIGRFAADNPERGG